MEDEENKVVTEDDYCLCGELIEDCEDAYDHMAKGY